MRRNDATTTSRKQNDPTKRIIYTLQVPHEPHVERTYPTPPSMSLTQPLYSSGTKNSAFLL